VGGVGGPGKPGGGAGASQLPSTGASQRPGASQLPSNNMYNNSANKDRVAPSTKQRDASMQKADRVAKGPNNVYADKNGNVQRRTSQGNWQSRDQGQWKSSPSNRPTQSQNNLNRDARARQQGANRSYGGGGARRGGGGGRRR
jgi:hypothetical protein